MKKRVHISISIILTLSIILSCIPLSAYSTSSDPIVIYHTNDMHGRINSVYSQNELTQIGLDVVKSAKENTNNAILIDAGDATQGTPMGKFSKGLDIVDVMNVAGYDGMTLGNHEFDYGQENVMKIAKKANFPVVSSNTLYNGDLFLKDVNGNNGENFIKEVGGKKLGFFGIITSETTKTTIPENLEGISFKDEIQTSKEQVEKLKAQGVDMIIGIMHIGIDSSSSVTSREIAESVPEINIIIDGHSHSTISEKVRNTVIQQTGTGSNTLGKIEIDYSSNSPKINTQLIPAKELGKQYTPSQDVTDEYNSIADKIEPVLSTVVGKTATTLYGGNYSGKNVSRMVETNLGSLICDAMIYDSRKLLKCTKYRALPIVAMENGGAVRSKIDKGFISMENILEVLPLDNKLTLQIITPNTLYKVMERGVCKQNLPESPGEAIDGFFGGFPQIGGMRIEYDLTQNAYDTENPQLDQGRRVTKIVILNEDGSDAIKLDRDDTLTPIIFACNDYTISEYPMVSNIDVSVKGDYLSDILAEYINVLTMRGSGEFNYPINQKRVLLSPKSNDLFVNYSAQISVKENSIPLANKEVSIKVDNTSLSSTTDENGNVILDNLQSGGHSVVVSYNSYSSDAYIDETVGIKSAVIDIAPDSSKNIKSVINLIDQIPDNPTNSDLKTIKFAKTSYSSLSNEEKSQVTNVDILLNSEDLLNENSWVKYFILTLATILAVSAVILIVKYKKKTKRG